MAHCNGGGVIVAAAPMLSRPLGNGWWVVQALWIPLV
jgi:hypothetical protein